MEYSTNLSCIKEQMAVLRDKIKGLEETLALMPEGTFLGRWCVKSYIKRYKKELAELDWLVNHP